MFNAIDNGILTTDLDANMHAIKNAGFFTPPPPNLVSVNDARLLDPRLPLDGSVTNDSISNDAAIDQSKLNLNGSIPTAWLGFDSTHAAQGDLAEYLSNKGIPGGYASLDGTGKLPVAQLPNDAGVGTVTSVALTMPPGFSVSGSPVTTTGTIVVTWQNVPDGTWFGNNSGVSAAPSFNTGPITASMVPQLPASKIVTGTIDVARMPPAVGLGVDHSAGAVPDPGTTGSATDYLARDMTYKPVPSIGPTYQPMVPDPALVALSVGADVTVSITNSLVGVSLFYRITGMANYSPAPSTVHVLSGQTLDVYGAKAGYTNSNIVFYVNP